jgi:hypothetical protein
LYLIAVMIRAAVIFIGETFAADTRRYKRFSEIGSLQRVKEFISWQSVRGSAFFIIEVQMEKSMGILF